MKKISPFLLVGTLTMSPAWAMDNIAHDSPDIRSIFSEDREPLQISLLSPEEMHGTKGEMLPLIMAGNAFASGVGYYIMTDDPNLEGFLVSAGTGAFSGFGFSGAMIGMLGQAYANEIKYCPPPLC